MKKMFGNCWSFFDNVLYFLPQNMNVHIQKMKFASTSNCGSLFSDLLPQFLFSIGQDIRTSGQESEDPAEIPNVQPRFRTSCGDSERPAEIPKVGGSL